MEPNVAENIRKGDLVQERTGDGTFGTTGLVDLLPKDNGCIVGCIGINGKNGNIGHIISDNVRLIKKREKIKDWWKWL